MNTTAPPTESLAETLRDIAEYHKAITARVRKVLRTASAESVRKAEEGQLAMHDGWATALALSADTLDEHARETVEPSLPLTDAEETQRIELRCANAVNGL